MIVSVACLWAAAVSIQNRYQESPYQGAPFYDQAKDVFPEVAKKTVDPVESKVLGSVELIIIIAAIAFRNYGRVMAWSAIAAAFVATAIAAAVAALRHSTAS